MVLANEDGNFPTEEQRVLAHQGDEEDEEQTEIKFPDWSEAVEETPYADPTHYPSLDKEEVEELNNNEKGAGGTNNLELAVLEQRNHDIQVQRAGTHKVQKKQAQKMLESSNQRYAPKKVEKTVHLPIDPVDRSKN